MEDLCETDQHCFGSRWVCTHAQFCFTFLFPLNEKKRLFTPLLGDKISLWNINFARTVSPGPSIRRIHFFTPLDDLCIVMI